MAEKRGEVRVQTSINNDQLVKGLRDSAKAIDGLNSYLAKVEESARTAETALAGMPGKIKEAANAAKGLALTPEALQQLDAYKSKIAELEGAYANAKAQLSEMYNMPDMDSNAINEQMGIVKGYEMALSKYMRMSKDVLKPFEEAQAAARVEVQRLNEEYSKGQDGLQLMRENIQHIKEDLQHIQTGTNIFNFERQATEARNQINLFEQEIQRLNGLLSKENDPVKFKSIQYELQATETALEKFKSGLSAPVTDIMNMQEAQAEIDKLNTQLSELTAKREQIQVDIEFSSENNAKIAEQKQIIAELQQSYNTLSSNVRQSLDEQIAAQKEVVQSIADYQNEVMIAAQKSGDYNVKWGASYSQINSEIAVVNASIDVLKEKIRDLTLKQSKLTDQKAILEIDSNIEQLEKQIQNFEDRYSTLSNQLKSGVFVAIDDSKLSRVANDLTVAEKELAALEQKKLTITTDNAELNELQTQLQQAQNKLAEMQSQLQRSLSFTADETQLIAQFEAAKQKVTELIAEQEKLPGYAEFAYDAMTLKIAKAEKELEVLRARVMEIDGVKAKVEIETNIAQTETEIAGVKGKIDELANTDISKSMRQNEGAVNKFGEASALSGVSARELGSALGFMIGESSSVQTIVRTISSLLIGMAGAMNKAKLAQTAMWTGVTLGVSVVIEGITRVISKFNEFKDQVTDTVKSFGIGFVNVSKNILNAVKNLDLFGKAIGAIKDGVNALGKNITGLAKNIGTLTNNILNAAKSTVVFKAMQGAINDVTSLITQWITINKDFTDSLNAIRVNLLTAFMPIVQTITPIILTFMQLLAQFSAVLAQFMATVFGSTYTKARDAAKGLYDQAKAINAVGAAAKKNEPFVASFDKIEKLSAENDGTGLSLADLFNFDFPEPELPDWIKDLADWVIGTFKPVFESIKKAWDALLKSLLDAWKRWGKDIISAWKGAVEAIAGLLTIIFDDLAKLFGSDAWSKFLDAIAKNIILIGDLINDIITSLTTAWKTNETGYKMLESFVTLWTEILELIHSVGRAFQTAWNSDNTGVQIFRNIFEIITNINTGIGYLVRNIRNAWDENDRGVQIWENILDIVNTLLTYINKASAAFKDWADGVNFATLLDSIIGLTDSLLKISGVIGDKLLDYFIDLLQFAKDFIEVDLPKYIDIVSGGLDTLADKIKDAGNIFDFLGTSAIGGLGIISDLLKEIISNIDWDSLGADIASGFNALFDISKMGNIGATVGDFVNSILDLFRGFIDNFNWAENSKALANGIRKFIKEVKPQDVADVINDFMKDVIAFFKEIPVSDIKDWAVQIIKAIDWKAAINVIKTIQEIKDIPKTIMNTIKKEASKAIVWDFIQGNLPEVIAGIGATIGTLIIVISKLAPAISGAGIAAKAAAAAQLLWNAAMSANPIGIIVIAVSALAVGIAALVIQFKKQESAIKTTKKAMEDYDGAMSNTAEALNEVEVATNNLEQANQKLNDIYNTLNSTVDSYENAVTNAEQAQERLAEAENAANMTGAELFQMFQNGTLTYQDMTDAQKELFLAYNDNMSAQQNLTTATENLMNMNKEYDGALYEQEQAQRQVEQATIDLQNAKIAEEETHRDVLMSLANSGKGYEEYQAKLEEAYNAGTISSEEYQRRSGEALAASAKDMTVHRDAVIDAFNRGEISAEEASEEISKSMVKMSDSVKKEFTQNIPQSINDGLDPKQYQTTGEKIQTFFKNIWQGIKDFLGIASPSKYFIDIGEQNAAGLEKGMSGAGDIGTRFINDLLGGIGNVKDKFLSIGRNMIEGIKNGLGDLKDKAASWFGGLIDGAKDVLRIASPSKEFEDIGEYSGEGVIVGFENMAKSIITAFSDIFDEILNTDVSLFVGIGKKIGGLVLQGLQLAEDPIIAFFESLYSKIEGLTLTPNITLPEIPTFNAGLDASTISSLVQKGGISFNNETRLEKVEGLLERLLTAVILTAQNNDLLLVKISEAVISLDFTVNLDGRKLEQANKSYANRNAIASGKARYNV